MTLSLSINILNCYQGLSANFKRRNFKFVKKGLFLWCRVNNNVCIEHLLRRHLIPCTGGIKYLGVQTGEIIRLLALLYLVFHLLPILRRLMKRLLCGALHSIGVYILYPSIKKKFCGPDL